MHPEQIALLVRKLLDRTATAEETARLRAYLENEKINPEEWLSYEDWENTSSSSMPASVRHRVLASIPIHKNSHPRKIVRILAASAAAAILLFVWVGVSLFSSGKAGHKAELVVQWAERGQSRLVVLPDSSRVYLNAGSRVSYSTAFGDGDRQITLSGEAFFEVATIQDRPFTVRTGDLTTTVLGTSFNVKAYPANGDFRVAVKSGKVKIAARSPGGGQEDQVLLPGQQASYASLSKKITLTTVDKEQIASWKNNELLFDGSSLGEILETLEYRYNIRFRPVRGLPAEKKFSVAFSHLSLQESLDKLSILGRLDFAAKGDSLIEVRPRP